MLILAVLLLSCVVIFCIYYRLVNREYFKSIENFVSIGHRPPYPIFGHIPILFWKSPNEKIKIFCDEILKTQRTAKFWIFSKLVIILNIPQDIQTVLCSPHCLDKGSPYKLFTGTGSGLATEPSSKWKSHRRLMNSPFAIPNIVKQIPEINEISRRIVKDLMPYCDGNEILLLDKIGFHIMDVAISVLFEHRFDKHILLKCFHDLEAYSNAIGKRLIQFYSTIAVIIFEKLFRIVPSDLKLLYGFLKILDAAFIKAKQNYIPMIEEDAKEIETNDDLKNCPDGFLKRIYRMKFYNCLTEAELEENLALSLAGGTNTTMTAIGNIILCLAAHPQIQDKLYTELESITGNIDELDWDTIRKLEYLDRVIKESLRFLPLIPFILRKADENIQLEDGTVPAGTDILIPIAGLHRREFVWGPNAGQFNPDNFLPENCQKRHPCSFIPFSYGSRNCIANRYAMTSLQIITAHLIQNYRFTTNLDLGKLQFEFMMTSRPESGYKILLSKRSSK